MLLGEHAGVYGHPCLVTAIDRQMSASVARVQDQVLQVETSFLDGRESPVDPYSKSLSEVDSSAHGSDFIEAAVGRFLQKYPLQDGGLRIKTAPKEDAVFGFGARNASIVAIVRALSELLDIQLPQEEIFRLSFQAVLDLQRGKGSGFDVAAATYGGTLYYRREGPIITSLDIPSLPLIIAYSGAKSDAVALMNAVEALRTRSPSRITQILAQIGQVVEKTRIALEQGDLRRVGKLMDANQELLEALEVSSPKLDTMISCARKAGAYGAKLSGAGRGDCVIVVAPDSRREAVENALAEAGGEVMDVATGAPPVHLE